MLRVELVQLLGLTHDFAHLVRGGGRRDCWALFRHPRLDLLLHQLVKPHGDFLISLVERDPLPTALGVLQPRVFELPDLVEFLERIQLPFEVGTIELVIVFEIEDPVLLQLLLEEISDLLGVQILQFKQVCGILGRRLNVYLLILDDFDTCAEETILPCLSDDLLLERDLSYLLVLEHT